VSQSLVEVEGFQEQIVKVLMLPVTCSTSAEVSSRAFWRLRTLLFSFIGLSFLWDVFVIVPLDAALPKMASDQHHCGYRHRRSR
jgi:hypothetical protein